MFSSKNYSEMTLDELVLEDKKLKSQQIPSAVFIGLIIGIVIWSATHKGGWVTIILIVFATLVGSRYSKNMKNIQAEISRRNTVG